MSLPQIILFTHFSIDATHLTTWSSNASLIPISLPNSQRLSLPNSTTPIRRLSPPSPSYPCLSQPCTPTFNTTKLTCTKKRKHIPISSTSKRCKSVSKYPITSPPTISTDYPIAHTPNYSSLTPPAVSPHKRKKVTFSQNTHYTTATIRPLRNEKQISSFTATTTSAKTNVESAQKSYQISYPTKGKLISIARGKPSLRHSFYNDPVFEHVFIHVILSDYIPPIDLKHLLDVHPLFCHLHKMMSIIDISQIYSLFTPNPHYASQTSIPPIRRIQFLFLAIIHKLDLPSVIRSLPGNYNALHRHPRAILDQCSHALSPDVTHHLRRVLANNNPSEFHGHTSAQQRLYARRYGNHKSISKNLPQTNKTLNKEERNKYIAVFPCWLERFFPHLHLTPQGLVQKEGKKDRLVFDGSFLVNPTSACVNHFASPEHEITLRYGNALTRHLTRIYNLRISYPNTEILLCDDDASGAFRHVKYHPDIE